LNNFQSSFAIVRLDGSSIDENGEKNNRPNSGAGMGIFTKKTLFVGVIYEKQKNEQLTISNCDPL
jgi:hypothetical protein